MKYLLTALMLLVFTSAAFAQRGPQSRFQRQPQERIEDPQTRPHRTNWDSRGSQMEERRETPNHRRWGSNRRHEGRSSWMRFRNHRQRESFRPQRRSRRQATTCESCQAQQRVRPQRRSRRNNS